MDRSEENLRSSSKLVTESKSKEPFVIEKIKNALPNRNIIYYRIIDSTQKKAREMIEKDVPDGTVIITDNQTNGVGTHGRRWYTNDKNNILMTIILYPNCNIQEMETITIDIANCIVDVIEEMYKIKLHIKEPNDIIFNDKKLGGILTESITYKNNVKTLLIGIGININQKKFAKEIKHIATSLKNETNKDFNREEIVIEILNRIEKMYKTKII